MSDEWLRVSLSELLTQIKREELIEPIKEYNLLGARLYAQGLFIRESKMGSTIKAKKLYRVENGDFVYNRLFAWKGTFALATEKEHNCYVSNEFPCFEINTERLIDKYLHLYFSRSSAWDEAFGMSYGATPLSRNRLKEQKLLSMEIPLPPIEEQQRIVAKIERLAKWTREAEQLQIKTENETNYLVKIFLKIITSTLPYDEHSLLSIANEEGSQVSAIDYQDDVYISLGDVEADTGRILRKRLVSEAGIIGTAIKFNKSNVLYSKLRPYLNKVCVPTFSGIGTSEFVTLKPNKEIIDRNFLAWYLRAPQIVKHLDNNSIGTKMPRTNMKIFRSLTVPIPPLDEQRRIVAYLDRLQAKVNRLKRLQTAAKASLDALLPSILDRAFKGEL